MFDFNMLMIGREFPSLIHYHFKHTVKVFEYKIILHKVNTANIILLNLLRNIVLRRITQSLIYDEFYVEHKNAQ